MDKKPENLINLDNSVSEQIADMQLARLREKAMTGTLDFNDIKVLEILSKVKNTEVEKREPKKEISPEKAKIEKMKALASANPIQLLPEQKVEDEKEKGPTA